MTTPCPNTYCVVTYSDDHGPVRVIHVNGPFESEQAANDYIRDYMRDVDVVGVHRMSGWPAGREWSFTDYHADANTPWPYAVHARPRQD